MFSVFVLLCSVLGFLEKCKSGKQPMFHLILFLKNTEKEKKFDSSFVFFFCIVGSKSEADCSFF